MSEAKIKEQVRERLLSAELAEVLEVDVAAIDAAPVSVSPPRRWLAAALLLLGLVVVSGVTFLRSHDAAEAEQREFDPTRPWWEDEVPFRTPLPFVASPGDVAALAAGADRVRLLVASAVEGTIEALLQRASLRELTLAQGGVEPPKVPWEQVGLHPGLQALAMVMVPVGDVQQLRALRRLPELRSLAFTHRALRLDLPAAEVLVEMPKLRYLNLAHDEVEPAAVAALAGLPHLDTLVLAAASHVPTEPLPLLAAAAQLRTLRMLSFDGDFELLDADALVRLRALPRLLALRLTNFRLDDACFAALPRGLQHLTFSIFDEVTASAVRSLAELQQLRSLSLHGPLPAALEAPLRALLPTLPLECFELSDGMPGPALWSVIENLPQLRRLRVRVGDGDSFAALAARCTAMRRLEVLFVSVPTMPTPVELSALATHPGLRRILLRRDLASTQLPTADELAALRAAAGCEVEVM